MHLHQHRLAIRIGIAALTLFTIAVVAVSTGVLAQTPQPLQ